MGAPEPQAPIAQTPATFSYEHEGDRQFATTLARGDLGRAERVEDLTIRVAGVGRGAAPRPCAPGGEHADGEQDGHRDEKLQHVKIRSW